MVTVLQPLLAAPAAAVAAAANVCDSSGTGNTIRTTSLSCGVSQTRESRPQAPLFLPAVPTFPHTTIYISWYPVLVRGVPSDFTTALCGVRVLPKNIKILYSCDIEEFVETHLCKLCVLLRSRVFLGVCPHSRYRGRRLPLELACTKVNRVHVNQSVHGNCNYVPGRCISSTMGKQSMHSTCTVHTDTRYSAQWSWGGCHSVMRRHPQKPCMVLFSWCYGRGSGRCAEAAAAYCCCCC